MERHGIDLYLTEIQFSGERGNVFVWREHSLDTNVWDCLGATASQTPPSLHKQFSHVKAAAWEAGKVGKDVQNL